VWALGSVGVESVSAGAVLAEVAVDEQHRGGAGPADTRASHASSGVWLQHPVDAAAQAAVLDRRVRGGPMAASTQVTVGFADRAATAPAIADPACHG
jgi:hypothetical protein